MRILEQRIVPTSDFVEVDTCKYSAAVKGGPGNVLSALPTPRREPDADSLATATGRHTSGTRYTDLHPSVFSVPPRAALSLRQAPAESRRSRGRAIIVDETMRWRRGVLPEFPARHFHYAGRAQSRWRCLPNNSYPMPSTRSGAAGPSSEAAHSHFIRPPARTSHRTRTDSRFELFHRSTRRYARDRNRRWRARLVHRSIAGLEHGDLYGARHCAGPRITTRDRAFRTMACNSSSTVRELWPRGLRA